MVAAPRSVPAVGRVSCFLRRRSLAPDQAGSFLGFEVADIELFRLERSKSNQLARERLARVGGIEARAS